MSWQPRIERWLEAAGLRDAAARLRAELDAEIADHLACSADEIRREVGWDAQRDSGDAEGLARRRFGDVDAVINRCLWIHLGDQAMLRMLGIIVVTVSCVGLLVGGALIWSSQQVLRAGVVNLAQRNLATQQIMLKQIDELRQELARFRAAGEPRKNPPIRGSIYRHRRDNPAAGAEIELRRLPDGEIYRRLVADADGTFAAEHLPEGEYFLLTPLLGPGNPLLGPNRAADVGGKFASQTPIFQIQSQPLYVSSGGDTQIVALDAAYNAGRLLLEFDRPIARQLHADDDSLVWTLGVVLESEHLIRLPWTPQHPQPPGWPARGWVSLTSEIGTGQSGMFMFDPTQVAPDQPYDWSARGWGANARLPADTYRIRATLMPQLKMPRGFGGGGFGGGGFSGGNTQPFPPESAAARFQQATFAGFTAPADGDSATLTLTEAAQPEFTTVEIKPDCVTRVRLLVDPEAQRRLAEVVLSTESTDAQLRAAAAGFPLGIEAACEADQPSDAAAR